MANGAQQDRVVVSGDSTHGPPHHEVLIMNHNADGPGGEGFYYNSLGVDLTLTKGMSMRDSGR